MRASSSVTTRSAYIAAKDSRRVRPPEIRPPATAEAVSIRATPHQPGTWSSVRRAAITTSTIHSGRGAVLREASPDRMVARRLVEQHARRTAAATSASTTDAATNRCNGAAVNPSFVSA
jgi:hypothetical protein